MTEDYTIDYWMHLRNTAVGDHAASEQMDAMFRVAFAEDKEVLEAIHIVWSYWSPGWVENQWTGGNRIRSIYFPDRRLTLHKDNRHFNPKNIVTAILI